MTKIEIYTKPFCPYCSRAKGILTSRGLAFSEFGSTMNGALTNEVIREQMIQRSGGKSSYPQVFIGDTYIGGSDDLAAWDADGRLDTLLAS